MSSERILNKESFLRGLEVGRMLWRLAGGQAEPVPETGPFQMKLDLQRYGLTSFIADLRGTFEIDWGDGTQETVSSTASSGIRHTYPSLGEYVITIDGSLTHLGQGAWSRNTLTAVTELLTPLPASLEVLSNAFSECDGLTVIPADLFSRCVNLRSVAGCFSETAISGIPAGLFDQCVKITTFTSCFSKCTGLTEIPAGLFDSCPEATVFDNCFLGCSALTEVPAGLFDGCRKVQSFNSCFYNCSKLAHVPEGLFQDQEMAESFSSCFGSCKKLAAIPDRLFDGCGAAVQFDSCFQSCTALTEIPEGLFDDCVKATQFRACFSGCYGLISVPAELFDLTAVSMLNECFMRCLALTHAPELWERFPDATHTRCFFYCQEADNYDVIPSGWK